MKNKTTNKINKKALFLLCSFLIPLIAAAVIMSSYGSVKGYVNSAYVNPFETEGTISSFFKGNYILYKTLYEKVLGESVSYADIYIRDRDGLLSESDEEYSEEELQAFGRTFDNALKAELENSFFMLLPYFEYYAEDTVSGTSISNTTVNLSNEWNDYFYYLELIYDENGSASILSAKSENSDLLMKNASECVLTKNGLLQNWMQKIGSYRGLDFQRFGAGPKNCRIIYGMTEDAWNQFLSSESSIYYGYNSYGVYQNTYWRYYESGVMNWITLAFCIVGLLALFLPLEGLVRKKFAENRLTNLPLEAVAGILFFLACCTSWLLEKIIYLLDGTAADNIVLFLDVSLSAAGLIAYLLHFVLLYVVFGLAWYLGLSLRPAREKGVKGYIKSNSLIYKIFPFCKRRIIKLYDDLEHIDVTKKAKRTILKIVLLNALVLFFISLLWLGGMTVTIVYSVCLYFGLMFYVNRMQRRYAILLQKIQEISSGNLNVTITEDLGIFEPFKEQLLLIQTGFRNAVEEEVKSQKMKSELITNVSHDLKTPLTAIITYVDLLKDENITEEQRKEYLDTLDRKSLRLKVLIEDLFEVSKATSGNVSLHCVEVDICNLVKQVELEMSDKLEKAGLDVRFELPEEKVICYLDSQKTYRIYENLFQNIAKYSLPGTRVYVQGTRTDNRIIISLKNISAAEITVDASRLTDRFVRGDVSRNTEGSGLGLAIVKSFVELQGGLFVLENDGDLFKAITSFPCK